jgi:hypothetical protein
MMMAEKRSQVRMHLRRGNDQGGSDQPYRGLMLLNECRRFIHLRLPKDNGVEAPIGYWAARRLDVGRLKVT